MGCNIEKIRTCIVCKEKLSARELMRVGYNENGLLCFQTKWGRGAYFCSKIECREKALTPKKLQHALRRVVSLEQMTQLKTELF